MIEPDTNGIRLDNLQIDFDTTKRCKALERGRRGRS
jgi:hypothetical protein